MLNIYSSLGNNQTRIFLNFCENIQKVKIPEKQIMKYYHAWNIYVNKTTMKLVVFWPISKKCHKLSLVSQIIKISQWISQIVLLFLFFLTRICKWWKKKCICAQTHWAHSSAIVSSKWEGWNITACIKNHVGWLVALGLVGHTG